MAEKNLQLINTLYFPKNYETNEDDKIVYIYKDVDTGKKHFSIVEDPEIEFYINKDDKWLERPVNFMKLEDVEKITSKNRYLIKNIAEELGGESLTFYKTCMSEGRAGYAKKLHLNANLHGSDINVTDFYIDKFLTKYGVPETNKLSKAFFDIEVDLDGYTGFPDENEAPCPVTTNVFFYQDTMTAYVFITRDESNESMMKFESSEVKSYKKQLIKEFKEEDNVEIKDIVFKFYDEEIDMIQGFFETVNSLKPDFLASWNSKFDLKTLMNRIKKLEYDEKDIICSPDIPFQRCFYYEDTRNQDFADKGDYFEASSYTNYIDSMLIYANLRKSNKKESYTLNAIAEEELGKQKVEFDGDETIKTLLRLNFKKFIKYNIYDVLLLYLLEQKTKDIEMIYNVAILTHTRINKALKKTVCLRNLGNVIYRNEGYVMSNNHNTNYGDNREPSEKFRGAFVANPKNNFKMGVKINGKFSKFIFDNVIDMDLSALYPSIILAFNIDSSTQFGKLVIKSINESDMFEDNTHEYMDYLASRNAVELGNKWFNLPSVEEMVDFINK